MHILRILKKNLAHRSEERNFLKLLGVDPSFGHSPRSGQWLALSALPNSLSLQTLKRSSEARKLPVPEELVMHIFIELVKATRFLHEECLSLTTVSLRET